MCIMKPFKWFTLNEITFDDLCLLTPNTKSIVFKTFITFFQTFIFTDSEDKDLWENSGNTATFTKLVQLYKCNALIKKVMYKVIVCFHTSTSSWPLLERIFCLCLLFVCDESETCSKDRWGFCIDFLGELSHLIRFQKYTYVGL